MIRLTMADIAFLDTQDETRAATWVKQWQERGDIKTEATCLQEMFKLIDEADHLFFEKKGKDQAKKDLEMWYRDGDRFLDAMVRVSVYNLKMTRVMLSLLQHDSRLLQKIKQTTALPESEITSLSQAQTLLKDALARNEEIITHGQNKIWNEIKELKKVSTGS